MIAKAGIIVATAAASLLAVSPLAFAGDYPGGSDKSHHKSHDSDHKKKGHDKNCKCDKGHDKDVDGDHGNWGGGHGGSDGHGGGGNGGSKSCKQDNSADSHSRGGGGGLINLSGNNVQVPIQACNNNVLSNTIVGLLSKGQSITSR